MKQAHPKSSLIASLGVSVLLGITACAQGPQALQSAAEGQEDLHPVLRTDTRKFDARDLNGIWTRGNPGGGQGGPGSCILGKAQDGPCGDRGFSKEWPEFTAEGQVAFEANKPSYGRWLGSEDAAAHPEEHIGRRRLVQQAQGNDPQGTCNPLGVTRAILFPQENEFVMVGDRILQHFSQTNAWRNIWMDGRALPEHDDIMWPLWYGYSAARWEGDTLVVETVGQDNRVWLDHFGYPISDEARIEERWRRIKHDVLELNMTLIDPKYYAKPWKSQTKLFHWRPKDYFTNSNWDGMYYDDCAPADEVDVFQTLFVNPAGKQ